MAGVREFVRCRLAEASLRSRARETPHSQSGYHGQEIVYRVQQDYYENEVATGQILVAMWREIGINARFKWWSRARKCSILRTAGSETRATQRFILIPATSAATMGPLVWSNPRRSGLTRRSMSSAGCSPRASFQSPSGKRSVGRCSRFGATMIPPLPCSTRCRFTMECAIACTGSRFQLNLWTCDHKTYPSGRMGGRYGRDRTAMSWDCRGNLVV